MLVSGLSLVALTRAGHGVSHEACSSAHLHTHSIAQQSRALLLLAAGDPSQQKGAKGDRKLLHSRLVSQDYLFLSYFRLLLSAAAVLYLSMLVPSSSLHTLILVQLAYDQSTYQDVLMYCRQKYEPMCPPYQSAVAAAVSIIYLSKSTLLLMKIQHSSSSSRVSICIVCSLLSR